jgi:riboflavin kinase/FMN adenylyltransferase
MDTPIVSSAPKNMDIIPWEAFLGLEKSHTPLVSMSIGVFDGVHPGHRSLINMVVSSAMESRGGEPWIITFRNNPKKVLRPDTFPGDLLPLRDKLNKLESLGIRAVIIIDFSEGFGKLKGVDFISLICEHCGLRFLAIGEDFHFGCGMDTNAVSARPLLEKRGVEVAILPPVYHGGSKISSTRIRGFIQAGDFSAARIMLGHAYRINLEGIGGKNCKSAARTEIGQVIPREGVYPVIFSGKDGSREGKVNIDARGISWHYDGDVEAITFV